MVGREKGIRGDGTFAHLPFATLGQISLGGRHGRHPFGPVLDSLRFVFVQVLTRSSLRSSGPTSSLRSSSLAGPTGACRDAPGAIPDGQ